MNSQQRYHVFIISLWNFTDPKEAANRRCYIENLVKKMNKTYRKTPASAPFLVKL